MRQAVRNQLLLIKSPIFPNYIYPYAVKYLEGHVGRGCGREEPSVTHSRP